jgi:hypothetical protein
MHHLIAAAAESSLAKGSWTEGRNIVILLVALAVFAIFVVRRRRREARQSIQRLQQARELVRPPYEAQPYGQYGPDGTYRHPSDLA